MTDSAFAIFTEVLLFIILVIVVLGNLFVIEAVCRHARLRTIPNICITSLAIADLFVGLLNIPMYMYSVYDDAYEKKYSEEFNLVLTSLDMYFGTTSILHLAFISMERCYAITCPLRRRFLQKGKQYFKSHQIQFTAALLSLQLYLLHFALDVRKMMVRWNSLPSKYIRIVNITH